MRELKFKKYCAQCGKEFTAYKQNATLMLANGVDIYTGNQYRTDD